MVICFRNLLTFSWSFFEFKCTSWNRLKWNFFVVSNFYFFKHFSCMIISFIFSMHPFIPHHDEVYTILKTIIWYFFRGPFFLAPFVLFSMQPIFIFALLSLSKNAYKHVPLELNSLFILYVWMSGSIMGQNSF